MSIIQIRITGNIYNTHSHKENHMKQYSNQKNPIIPRANAKLVEVGHRKFLIGGMTADKVTSDIYELRTLEEDGNLKIEWKLTKFKNNLFKPRNSYSACGSNNKIYIWGGLESKEMDQICLSDLIELDIEKYEMKLLPLEQKIKIHSAALLYDADENQLVGIGGTNQLSTMQSFFYTLKLDLGEQSVYSWKKARLDCEQHKGYLWQHTAHLSKTSYFSGEQGKFLTVIGGCHMPQSPYNSIVEFNLKTMKRSNSTTMKYGLVSHDSLATGEEILIFGGATGGDFNNNKIRLSKGAVSYEKGHNAVGCSCCYDEKGYYVVGGVSGPESLNAVVIYRRDA